MMIDTYTTQFEGIDSMLKRRTGMEAAKLYTIQWTLIIMALIYLCMYIQVGM